MKHLYRDAHDTPAADRELLVRLLNMELHSVVPDESRKSTEPWRRPASITTQRVFLKQQGDRFDALLLRGAQIFGSSALLLCALWLFNGPLYDTFFGLQEPPSRPSYAPTLAAAEPVPIAQLLVRVPQPRTNRLASEATPTPPIVVPSPEPTRSAVAGDRVEVDSGPVPVMEAFVPELANPVTLATELHTPEAADFGLESVTFPSFRLDSEPPIWIQAASAGIDAPVINMFYENGTWSPIDYAAGYMYGSGDPGEPGNVVIAGHAGLRGGVFMNLPRVRLGDDIVLYTTNYRFIYRVSEVKVVWPSQLEVLDAYANASLTLFSCTNWDTQRLVVVADFVSGDLHPILQPTDS
jgi:LPXTG-site transpeptidase (sortase) family protein